MGGLLFCVNGISVDSLAIAALVCGTGSAVSVRDVAEVLSAREPIIVFGGSSEICGCAVRGVVHVGVCHWASITCAGGCPD